MKMHYTTVEEARAVVETDSLSWPLTNGLLITDQAALPSGLTEPKPPH